MGSVYICVKCIVGANRCNFDSGDNKSVFMTVVAIGGDCIDKI